MENKHFSHSHGLIYQQMFQGTEIQCSGCESSVSGCTVYVCWQCSYFLHDQCYGATRSLKHPSHPTHPLTLVPYPTYPSNSFRCNHCNLIGSGFSYCCSECQFDLHIHCALETRISHFPIPNNYVHHHGTQNNIFNPNGQPSVSFDHDHGTQGFYPPPPPPHPSFQIHDHHQNNMSSGTLNFSPSCAAPDHVSHQPPVQIALLSNPLNRREIKHFSHPHELYLTQQIEEEEGDDDDANNVVVACSGCEQKDNLSGSVFFYRCTDSQCNFILHKSCFELPREIRHKSHLEHPLTLLAKPPSSYKDGKFACNACLQDGAAFVYNCSTCTFDLHIECVSLPESIKRPDHKHPLNLFYSNPVRNQKEEQEQEVVVSFVCDVCQNPVHEMAWTYYCHECDFGTHLECAAFEVRQPAVKTQEELIRETEMKLALLQFLLNGRDPAAAAGGIAKEVTLQSAVKKSS